MCIEYSVLVRAIFQIAAVVNKKPPTVSYGGLLNDDISTIYHTSKYIRFISAYTFASSSVTSMPASLSFIKASM